MKYASADIALREGRYCACVVYKCWDKKWKYLKLLIVTGEYF